jgi:uncharacterized protein YkwD
MLDILNATRAQYGVSPLTLNTTQSAGTATCPGAYGHSQAMAQSGQIWHQNANYPKASFPADICVSSSTAGENVGQYSSSSELNNLQQMNTMMMNEPHDAVTCRSVNHACNILDSAFRQVGIGIYQTGQTTWLTEDFIG